MSVPYIIGFVILFVLQAVSTCVFLKVEIPRPSKKSLILKLTCSTIFLANAVLAMFCAGNYSNYTFFILVGLCFSWAGDFLLHYKTTENFFIAGVLIFLCGLGVFLTLVLSFVDIQKTAKGF